jgi:hypothetical protein
MRATIYVSDASFDTMTLISPLDYYDRCVLSDTPETDPTGRPGYYLKNLSNLDAAVLPKGASIALALDAVDGTVSFPTALRGCIFEHAPRLPPDYKDIVTYWSGTTVNSNASGAAYYQNRLQAYDVCLSALANEPELMSRVVHTPLIDALVSEGVVVAVIGLGSRLVSASDTDFVSIGLAIDDAMLGLDNGELLTGQFYRQMTSRSEQIFLNVGEVRRSPNPDRIYIDILRYEELDYGFYY